jgi:hypothetical protein
MKLIAAATAALLGASVFASDLGVGRVYQSVVPALLYPSSCRSRVVLLNTSDTPVKVEVEGHAETGALVSLRWTCQQNLVGAAGAGRIPVAA